jgi:hypothetical protein
MFDACLTAEGRYETDKRAFVLREPGNGRATTSKESRVKRWSSWSDLNKCEVRDENEMNNLLERCKEQKFLEKVEKIIEEKSKSVENMRHGRYSLYPDEDTAYEYGGRQYTDAKDILEKIAQGNPEVERNLAYSFRDNQLTGAQKRLLNAAREAAPEVQRGLDVQGSQKRSLLRRLSRRALSRIFSSNRWALSDDVRTLEVDVAMLAESPGWVETQHRIFLTKNFEQLKAEYPDHSDEDIFRLAWEKTFNDTWRWMEKKDSNGHRLVTDEILKEAKKILRELNFRREENLKIRIKPSEDKKSWRDYLSRSSAGMFNLIIKGGGLISSIQTISKGLSWFSQDA